MRGQLKLVAAGRPHLAGGQAPPEPRTPLASPQNPSRMGKRMERAETTKHLGPDKAKYPLSSSPSSVSYSGARHSEVGDVLASSARPCAHPQLNLLRWGRIKRESLNTLQALFSSSQNTVVLSRFTHKSKMKHQTDCYKHSYLHPRQTQQCYNKDPQKVIVSQN